MCACMYVCVCVLRAVLLTSALWNNQVRLLWPRHLGPRCVRCCQNCLVGESSASKGFQHMSLAHGVCVPLCVPIFLLFGLWVLVLLFRRHVL